MKKGKIPPFLLLLSADILDCPAKTLCVWGITVKRESFIVHIFKRRFPKRQLSIIVFAPGVRFKHIKLKDMLG